MSGKPAKTQQPETYQLDPINSDDLVKRRETVKETMNGVMVEGTHYGSVGDVDRPTLLKPGAEVLCNLFNLGADPEITIEEKPDVGPADARHREYHADVEIFHIPSGKKVGVGSGSCTTEETKYRYRWEYYDTKPPNEYWESGDGSNSRDETILWETVGTEPQRTIPEELEQIKPHKNGSWKIKVRRENAKLADTYNTVKKMSKKRGLVDAVLTALGVSAMFTQDVDEGHISEAVGAGSHEGQATGGTPNGHSGGHEPGQRGGQGGGQGANGRPPAKPTGQATAPGGAPTVDREDEEGRFERCAPETQKRLRKMDLYLLKGSNEVLPNRLQVVRGSVKNGAQTPAAAYAEHLAFLHSQRLGAPTTEAEGYPNEAQRGLLYGESSDYGWDSGAMERLVEQGWGFGDLALIPSREVFDEILLQFRDPWIRSVFSRDPDTREMDFQEGNVQPGAGLDRDNPSGAGGDLQEDFPDPSEDPDLPEGMR